VKHTAEDFNIHNFEVVLKEEKKVAYASGVRGIRALRMQRDVLQDQEVHDEAIMNSTQARDKFFNASQRAEANKQMRLEKQDSTEKKVSDSPA
jgi:septum formation inhibitor-activating ATPase MinD